LRKILYSMSVSSLLDSVTSRARVRKKLERQNHRSFDLRETKKRRSPKIDRRCKRGKRGKRERNARQNA
jgi:hypothetical protein